MIAKSKVHIGTMSSLERMKADFKPGHSPTHLIRTEGSGFESRVEHLHLALIIRVLLSLAQFRQR